MKPLHALILCLLLMTGCAGSLELKPEEIVPVSPATAAELLNGQWNAVPAHYRAQLTMVMRYDGVKMPLMALLDLDYPAGKMRLVGFAESGLNLFDIETEGWNTRLLGSAEVFRNASGFSDFIGEFLGAVFLAPPPRGNDRIQTLTDRHIVSRQEGEKTRHLVFAGDGRLLAESLWSGEGGSKVRFSAHREMAGLTVPGMAEFDDGSGRGGMISRVEWLKRVENGP